MEVTMTTQLLVPLHTFPDGNASTIVPHVRSVARHLGADVHAAVFVAEFPHIGNPLGNLLLDADELARTAKARSRQNAASLLADLHQAVESDNIAFRSSEIGYFPTELSDKASALARYHDIALMGIGAHDDALRGTAEEVVFGSGRPVLLVPEDLTPKPYDHIAIAWDGSRVAARAVSDSWRFLRMARMITVFCVPDEKQLPGDDIGENLVSYLRRHDLDAGLSKLEAAGRSISETLQASALDIGAGLLVMGGFGHSRMRDFVLGGATDGILKGLRMPVLMAH
jgi:nucleotide-binding universal stress UspA family protein